MSMASPGGEEHVDMDVFSFADLIVDYINQMGVDCVFGVPGGAIEPLYNALAISERFGGAKAVVARHEAGAAFMADGYARETDKIGVCCATTGPGATNLITGVASAYADNIPMLVITAQTPLPKFGKKALQDSSCSAIDTVSIFRHCCKYSTLVSHHEQLETKLISAVMAACNEPAGPVHISVPSDVLRTPATKPSTIDYGSLNNRFNLTDHGAIEKLVMALKQVDNVVLFLGDGCKGASEGIMQFAELLNAPIITGPMGKRWVDETHPLYRGVYGFSGHDSANELLADNQDIELVVAIGAALGELGTSGWNQKLLNDKLVHIDSKVEHFSRSHMAKLHVCGHLPSIFQIINDRLLTVRKLWNTKRSKNARPRNINGCCTSLIEEAKCFETSSPVKPQWLFTFLSRALPKNTRVFVDAGNAWSWSIQYFQRPEHDGQYHLAMGLGAMAWAVGATVGSAAGSSGIAPHVCITGDGSYLMSAQEITVAKQLKLPVVFMVLNDSVLGMVMHGQRLGRAEQIGFELGEVDFSKMAEAMGIEGIVVTSNAELENVDFDRLFTKTAPTLIDVRIDKEEVPPMGDRVKGLAVNGEMAAMPATPGG
ncbi:thiamine pyrophosphate-binding protein [Alteromonas sp. a30]|uniref:thiamine pyrophosphate-binding protein n=1 Tax=Alteromonas sp. a30 TaxID=2730917 RepID=UPI002281EEA2|nr:thiamine pyrophosphate-binding protein [Alteromonas sp. a30]MCY7294162.1 thiamine pyrophosphate-binding protein [Alteromonas sp. a30]